MEEPLRGKGKGSRGKPRGPGTGDRRPGKWPVLILRIARKKHLKKGGAEGGRKTGARIASEFKKTRKYPETGKKEHGPLA